MRVVRLRPGLIFKREAASGDPPLFLGPLLPSPSCVGAHPGRARPCPACAFRPCTPYDVADAYRLAVVRDVAGAFNVAADPVLDPAVLGDLLGARPLRVAPNVLRALADLTWKLRLQPTPPGWLDIALGGAAHGHDPRPRGARMGPRSRSTEAFGELLEGLRLGDGATPPLDAAAAGPLRLREFPTGAGARSR